MFAHGDNYGHGFVKKVVIDDAGIELSSVVFPSQVAKAESKSAGAIATAPTVHIAGQNWWTGDDAIQLGTPISRLSQDRLSDPVFIPALAVSARYRIGQMIGGHLAGGYCVTGLPGSWADSDEMSRQLFETLRSALPGYYQKIQVIAEQEALAFCAMLNNDGELVDSRYSEGRGLSIDLGHHTDDVGKLDKARRVRGAFRTYQTGTARALLQHRNLLSAQFDRPFTIAEADLSVRAGEVKLGGGRTAALPQHWDRPFIENADNLAHELKNDYGNGGDLDYVLLGGGGALVEVKVDRLKSLYTFAEIIDDPQLAIARGYARLARRRAKALQAQAV